MMSQKYLSFTCSKSSECLFLLYLYSLQLDVDDSEMVKIRSEGRRRIVTTSPLFFGGVPPGYEVVSQNVATEKRFVGCIGDVTVNGA